MPEPKALSSYPLEYFELFTRAAGEDVVITLKSPKDAARMRNRLYAFKRAVSANPEQAGAIFLLIGLVKLRIVDSTIIAGPTEPDKYKDPINAALRRDDSNRDASTSTTSDRPAPTGGTPSVRGQHDDDKLQIMPGEISK